MIRRFLPWLVSLSLFSLGSLVAHSLAYRIAEPAPEARAALLAETGHGYLAAVPLVVGASLAIVLVALAALAVRARRGVRAIAPSWPLALLPPLGFALQENLERALGASGWSGAAVLEPTFLIGLALQLPFALLALAVARRLTRAAEALGLGRGTAPRPVASTPLLRCPDGTILVSESAVALGHAGRGPPS